MSHPTCRDLIWQGQDPYATTPNQNPDLQGWNSNHAVFAKLMGPQNVRRVCEVGTWKGASAIHMVNKSGARPGLEITCVDTWLGSLEMWLEKRHLINFTQGTSRIYDTFRANVKAYGYEKFITPFPATSQLAAQFFQAKGVKFDLVYIDASHEAEDVERDLSLYLPFAPIIFGDDWDWESVRQGVGHVLDSHPNSLNLQVWDEKWIIRKL